MRNFTFILKSIVLLFALTFSTNAWGNTWTGKVGVGSGKGTATVTVYKYPFGVKTNSGSASSSNSTLQTATTDGWSTTDGSIEFTSSAETGYTFYAWYSNVGCTKDEDKSSTYTKGKNRGETTTRYAKFTPNKYTVKFNGNGGSAPADITVTYDAVYGELPIPTRTGYTFNGWWTATSSGTQVTASTTVKITATQTLYARWTANNYTITLNSDLATSHGTESIAVTFDSNTNLTSAIICPSRDKWTFWGYFTGENGAGTKLIDKEGNVLASVSGFTDSNKKWIHADNLTLYAHLTEKSDQTITWDNITDGQEYATGTMGAIASSGLTVTYTYKDNCDDWAYINENNRLVVLVPNKTVTITARQDGDDDYNAAEPISRTFVTLGANPNQTTEVTASGITYGQTLSVSTLSGKVYLDGVEIVGKLSWVDPSIMPNAGTANHMVLFTPTNTDVYSSIYFEVPVTVAKATPVITWNISNILRESVRYGHFVESSNKEQNFSIEVSDATLLNVTGVVLTTGELGKNPITGIREKVTGLTITLTQEASDNYNRKTETKTVAIYPKASICLPIDLTPTNVNAESDFNDANDAQVGSVNWCNTTEEGFYDDYIANIDVYYTQRVGIALGTWEDGLTGLGDAILHYLNPLNIGKPYEFGYSNKSVDLFFSGIPDAISFDVESQVVTSVGHLFGQDIDVPWPATAKNWHLSVSEDGENYTQVASRVGDGSFNYTFTNDNIRFVRIEYRGNFTGFVKNLRITRKQYISSDKSSLLFGTDTPLNPLQEPQPITLSYSSLGICGGSAEDAITITSSNPAFYVDEETITENVGIEQKGSYTIRVRCNDVNQEGMLTCTSNDGATLSILVRSTNPPIRTAATYIFQTGTEHNPVSGEAYRALRTHDFSACFDDAQPKFEELYIYGVSESAADSREWEYSPAKGYKVPVVNASNVHTPCFVYKKDGEQYTHVRTFDAATTALDITDSKAVFVGYRPEGPAATALQLGTGAVVNLNNTEIVSTGVAIRVNGDTATVAARGKNSVTSASNAAVQLAGTTTLAVNDSWKTGEASGILALRPASGYPSIDLGSASGRVYINGTQLELHNGKHMAIAHMDGTTEKFDGEVHITDGSIGGEVILGMPKLTFIDGGTFNDGTVNAYTLKGVAKRPRNSRGEIVSRHTMAPAALAAGYSWYGQNHLTPDGSAKVNPMLMDEEIWIFNGEHSVNSDDPTSWNKGAGLPGENDDVLIDAPMVISGGELKVKSLTINWVVNKEKGIPAVTVNPDGGLTVGEGGIDGIKVNMVNNLALKAGAEGATKGQTGFLRIHPNSAEPMPEATIELFTKVYTEMDENSDRNLISQWQYVGSPIAENPLARTVFVSNMIYYWNEGSGKWVNDRRNLKLEPFAGYLTNQYKDPRGKLVTFTGHLVPNDNVELDLVYTEDSPIAGTNVLANSYAAPIDITKIDATDFSEGASATIYMFNTGSRQNIEELDLLTKGVNENNAPGQYIGIPVGVSDELRGKFSLPTIIPSMQGFYVHTTKDATLTLDYNKIVWNAKHPNVPLRVKAHDEGQALGALKISVYADGLLDHLYMLESEQYDAAYENGYDARKMEDGEFNIFAIEGEDKLSVDATNSFIGTRVGVRTGEETMYTFFFSHLNSEKELALLDWETETITEITENAEYTFFAESNSMITDRFEIIEWDGSNKPGIATGVENVENGSKAHKFIKDNQLFILKNGVLYNATGVLVR